RDGRGVAREDHPFRAVLFDFLDHAVLEVQVLEHGLDHQVHVAKPGVVQGRGEAARFDLSLYGADAAALYALIDELADIPFAARQPLWFFVLEPHVQAALDGNGANARTHQARAQHGDAPHREGADIA